MDGTGGANALGEFLRARREQVRPRDVGLPDGAGPRRVPGLRREEVATLAGISADYYLRLEQGRDRNPSPQVLEALAGVLRLDADATAHLMDLAEPRTRTRSRRRRRAESVPGSILALIDGWTANPAYVQNRYADVLAANALARALSPAYTPGGNALRSVFLDPAERRLRHDWEALTEEGVARLRANVGPDVDDPRLVELVGELSLRSERFRELWARHDARLRPGRITHLDHPLVGPLVLHSDKLAVSGTDGLLLVVFHAEPAGGRDAELLALLGSIAAGERPRGRAAPDADTPGTSADLGDRREGGT